MFKKIISVLMAMVMVVFCIPATNTVSANSILDSIYEMYNTYMENNDIITSTEFEGNTISCKYVSSTKEYFLYFNDFEYKLNVVVEDDAVLVDIVNEDTDASGDVVYGQNPALIMIAQYIPQLESAIQTCVVTTISVVGTAIVTYVSVDLLNNVYLDNSAVLATINTDVADAATSVFTSGTTVKTEYDDAYFEARIESDDSIFIGRLLTYKEALIRLQKGYDILAVDSVKACFLATVASPVNLVKKDGEHIGPGDRLPHYHPVGISWYRSKRHNPHVWYMY